MVFQNNDDLVYPNLVNCKITTSNALLYANNKELPPPPPSFSASSAQSLLSKPPIAKYDFNVEKQILTRDKERGGKSRASRGLDSDGTEQGSVEVTLSDLKDALE